MSIISQAEDELRRINFGEEDTQAMLIILRLFFATWDSGGAVAAVLPVLNRCIAGEPLSPLTGEDDEWMEVDTDLYQNRRCATVFKQDGRCYDIDVPGRPTITFPYYPKTRGVEMPEYEISEKRDDR